jgi:hypothetical protein
MSAKEKKPTRWTARQRAFVHHYADCLNGAKAARLAGYAAHSAKITASQLLARPNVRAEADRLIRLRSRMAGEEIIARLESQAQGDISDFFYPGTFTIDPAKLHELGYLVQSVWSTNEGIRISLYNSQKALELLGKTRALFVERQILEMLDGLEIIDAQETGPETPPAASSAGSD